MMQSVTSENNLSIEIALLGRVYNTSSLSQFSLTIPLCGIPVGTMKISLINDTEFMVHSGEHGLLQFSNSGSEDLDGTSLSFVVTEANQEGVKGTNNYHMNIAFKLGSFKTHETKTLQKHGTSTEVMVSLLKSAGFDEPVNALFQKSTGDMMNWLCIRDTAEAHLDYVCDHSFLEGDYVYYTFSTDKGNFIISSFNESKTFYPRQMFAFSVNAYQNSDSAKFIDDTSGYHTWLFNQEIRENVAGKHMEELFPNIVYSTFDEQGRPEIGMCDSNCFGKLLEGAGYQGQEEFNNSLGASGVSFGKAKMVIDSPMNTHNMYQVAPIIRNRYLATYSKQLAIPLTNVIGPDVGSTVLVYTKNKENVIASGVADEVYADEYVVLGKTIYKNNDTNNNGTNVDDIYVLVKLGSPRLLDGNAKNVTDEFNKIKFPGNDNKTQKI